MQQILDEKQLSILNTYIDQMIEHEKNRMPIDWEMVLAATKAYITNFPMKESPKIRSVEAASKEEIIATVLGFFESLGDDIYKEALEKILHAKHGVITNMYDIYNVKTFSLKNELGLPKYSTRGNTSWNNNGISINIPLNKSLTKKESQILDSEATFEDIFLMVHEVAYTLDLGDLRPGNFTRELIGEATSMGFELALSDYLLENSRFSQEGIKTYKNDLMRSIYFDSKKVF